MVVSIRDLSATLEICVTAPIDDTSMVEASRAINRLNCAWALAQLPALTVPAPTGASGLPVGAQLVGPPGSDWRLLAAAARAETA